MPARSKKRKLDKDQAHIVIVGAGLAGLSAAVALEKAGFQHIAIFERDESFEQQKEGYGLTLTYNPKGPLASLGILEKVAQLDCPSRSHYLFRPDGSIMGYFGNAFAVHRGAGQRGNLRIPRKVLRRMLINQLQSTTIHWGHYLSNWTFDDSKSRYTIDFFQKGEGLVYKKVCADLFVAADGIRSATLNKIYTTRLSAQKYLSCDDPKQALCKNDITNYALIGLRDTNIRLILGISNFSHPLLQERGFYTLDGKHRLFTMPYSSNRFDKTQDNRIMWQLSFSGAKSSDSLDALALRQFVMNVCGSWHDPVPALIAATPLEKIWGTDLLDRNPEQVQEMMDTNKIRRLVVIGDALHSMTPFKGQGANQALMDGPLLASWLQRASIDSAVKSFWRETVQRTAPVVEASRLAAKDLHSPSALKNYAFAGVRSEMIDVFLGALQSNQINASLSHKLDSSVRKVIKDLDAADTESPVSSNVEQETKSLEFAALGDTASLRRQSLAKHSESIRNATDEKLRTCLHLAVLHGHVETCKWLLFELNCDPLRGDSIGETAIDYKNHHQNELVRRKLQDLFKVLDTPLR